MNNRSPRSTSSTISTVIDLLTNDFRGCHPRGETGLEPISLVCKLMAVEGRPAVKLSDNARKSTGPEEGIARYRQVFGSVAVEGALVTV